MKRIIPIIIAVLFIAGNCFALGNNNNCNTNGQNQGQSQGQLQTQQQGQAQLQGQAQSSTNINANLNSNKNVNKNANLNANSNTNKNANINGNLNANKVDSDINITDNSVAERDYIQPLQIALPTGVQGHNESIKNKGRRFISIQDQTIFSDILTVETAKIMVSHNSFGAKVRLTAKVKKGMYASTKQITIYSNMSQLPEGDYIEIAIAAGQSKGKSNSAMLTAKSVIEGCELGADILVGFDADSERRFKHRGIGTGGSVIDAFGTDTAAGGIAGINFGSSRYEQFPFQNCYLLKKVSD